MKHKHLEAVKCLLILPQLFVDPLLLPDNVLLVVTLRFYYLMTKCHLSTLSRNAFTFHGISDLTRYLENHKAARDHMGPVGPQINYIILQLMREISSELVKDTQFY